MLRFSNRSLHASMEVIPAFSLWNVNAENVSAGDVAAGFNRKLRTLLKSLRSEAAGGGDLLKFATGSASVRVGPRNSNQLTIYALVQCTPDLSETDCKRCLYEAFGHIPRCCHGKDTGRLVKPSCNLRFELSLFFDPAATVLPLPVSHDSPPPISANTTSQGMENKTLWIVVTIGLAGGVGVLVLIICCYYLRVNTKEKAQPAETLERPKRTPFNVTEISFDTVKLATGDFDEEKKLGGGGFGPVYKGRLDGQDIAVKRLSTEHGQGDIEFSSEVSILGNLRHDNLVKLLHFSVEGDERVLVYEFVPNASLDRFIFDQNEGEGLDWEKRNNIIVGTAKGIHYLHDNASPRFIHRDIKASNILLDAEWNPKIADLGMAKLFNEDGMQQYTTRLAGTRGYVAPEYASTGRYSFKSDVYSFGVVTLEIVRGEKNINFRYGENGASLVNYAWEIWGDDEERISNLIDPMLMRTSGSGGSEIIIRRCIKIALLCLQENEEMRPTMGEVVDMLTGSDTLPDPVRREQEPVIFANSSIESDQSGLGNLPVPVSTHSVVSSGGIELAVVSTSSRLDRHDSSAGIVSDPASPRMESEGTRLARSRSSSSNHVVVNTMENEAYKILGMIVTAPISIASKVSEVLHGLCCWLMGHKNEPKIRRHRRIPPKKRPWIDYNYWRRNDSPRNTSTVGEANPCEPPVDCLPPDSDG